MPHKNPEEAKAWAEKNRHKRLSKALESLGGVCVECGTEDNLQFDHIDPKTKLFNISWGVQNGTREAFWAEVAKCQLLCRPHHDEKTAAEGSKSGESHGLHKLTEEDVKNIRSLAALGHSHAQIAGQFGVSQPNVSKIVRRATWKHV